MSTKPVLGYPGYAVTAAGEVFTFWRRVTQQKGESQRRGIRSAIGVVGRELRSFDRKDRKGAPTGYRTVCLSREGKHKNFYVHDLVLTAFVGPRPTAEHEACHRNGERSDNRLGNLRWGTVQENAEERRRHERARMGTRHSPPATDFSPESETRGGFFDDLLAQGAA